jgi:hypothetical protein
MKWGSSVSENPDLSLVHKTDLAAYYAKKNTIYMISSQPVPGVFYGFYNDKLFAAFIKLRSHNQCSSLKDAFDTKYGDAKSTFDPESGQRVDRWENGNVIIKLKMIEDKGQFKIAFYYAPLSNSLNEERLENIPPGTYNLSAPKAGDSTREVPLLDK